MENALTFNKEEVRLNDLLIKESTIRKYIIDASVVFKWYYKKDEKDLDQAELLYELFNFIFQALMNNFKKDHRSTGKVLASIKQDELIGSFISLEEASEKVGKISNAYKNDDIDLTILLTHIGFESDIELAEMLKEEWGVDLIIGGHSHTILDQPKKVDNILITQAGVGSDQIGRFDIILIIPGNIWELQMKSSWKAGSIKS